MKKNIEYKISQKQDYITSIQDKKAYILKNLK